MGISAYDLSGEVWVATHCHLPLAILTAFVDAQRIDTPSPITSVPTAPRHADVLCEPVYRDNFA